MGIDEEYFKIDNNKPKDKIEDILEEDERVLVRLKPNKKAYILERVVKMMPIALIWLLFDGAFIAIMLTTGIFTEAPEMIFFIRTIVSNCKIINESLTYKFFRFIF